MPEHRILDIVDLPTLIDWVRDARQRTFELVADLTDEQLMGPQLFCVNPGRWEIGHHAWFQSYWVLRHAARQPPVRPDEDALYDSITIAHDDRWNLPLPTRTQTLDYLHEVEKRTIAVLQDSPSHDLVYHALYSTLHEDMHTEAHTYTRQTHHWARPRLGVPFEAPQEAGAIEGDAQIPGGTYTLGAERDEPFVFDNEKWAHPVELRPFRIARGAVTQQQFAAFVDDGGYEDQRLWDEEGWQWRSRVDAKHPVHWQRSPQGWQRYHFDELRDLEPHRPIIHVNWFEAQAYCRWAGRRLPTEAEWEAAAIGQATVDGRLDSTRSVFPWGDEPMAPERANLDWRAMDTVDVAALPAGDSAWGCRQMIGNVWEWTSTTFAPFPGFVIDPYKDYSEPWFHTRKVMRGGCWTTRRRLMRSQYRNFQTPDRRDVLTGFRTCAV